MDPDTNLKEQLALAQSFISMAGRHVDSDVPPPFDPIDVERLAELVLVLDAWMHKGGYPPKAWSVR